MDRRSRDEANGRNRRRRNSDEDHQLYQNDRPVNRRRTNGTNGAEEVEDGEEQLSLSLSLGPPTSMTSPQQPPIDSSPFLMTSSLAQPPSSMASRPQSPLRTFLLPPPPPPGADFFSSRSDFRSVFVSPPLRSTAPEPETDSAGRDPRRISTTQPGTVATATVPPPYPWATNQRGRIQSLEYLESKQITAITGDVQCKHCEKLYQISYDLREKFTEVEKFIEEHKENMRERAPATWMNPVAMRCEFCDREKAVKPVISERKRKINWLFLLLGKHLGSCTLEQLKYFCKHSNNHRTGAKDRVLYLTYLGLCKMLKPCELFDR